MELNLTGLNYGVEVIKDYTNKHVLHTFKVAKSQMKITLQKSIFPRKLKIGEWIFS